MAVQSSQSNEEDPFGSTTAPIAEPDDELTE